MFRKCTENFLNADIEVRPQLHDTQSMSSTSSYVVTGDHLTTPENDFMKVDEYNLSAKPEKALVYSSKGATAKARATSARINPLAMDVDLPRAVEETNTSACAGDDKNLDDVKVDDFPQWPDLLPDELAKPEDPIFDLTTRHFTTDADLVDFALNSVHEKQAFPGRTWDLFFHGSWKVGYTNYHHLDKTDFSCNFMNRTLYAVITSEAADLILKKGVLNFGGRTTSGRNQPNFFFNFGTSLTRAIESNLLYLVDNDFITDREPPHENLYLQDNKFVVVMLNFSEATRRELLVDYETKQDLTFNRIYASLSYFCRLRGTCDSEGNLDRSELPEFLAGANTLEYPYVDLLTENLRTLVNSGQMELGDALRKSVSITILNAEMHVNTYQDVKKILKTWRSEASFLSHFHTFRFGDEEKVGLATYKAMMTSDSANFGQQHVNFLLGRERQLRTVRSQLHGIKIALDATANLNVKDDHLLCNKVMQILKDADLIKEMVCHDWRYKVDFEREAADYFVSQGLSARALIMHYSSMLDYFSSVISSNLSTCLEALEQVRRDLNRTTMHWDDLSWPRSVALLKKCTYQELKAVMMYFGLEKVDKKNKLSQMKLVHLLNHFAYYSPKEFRGHFLDGLLSVLDLSSQGNLSKAKKLDHHFENDYTTTRLRRRLLWSTSSRAPGAFTTMTRITS